MRICILKEEIEQFKEKLQFSNFELIDATDIKKEKCEILFVYDTKYIPNYDEINSILFETPNCEFVVINDINLLNKIACNFDKITDIKIDGDKNKIFRYVRIDDVKLCKRIIGFRNFYYTADENGAYKTIFGKNVSKCYNYKAFNENYEKDISQAKRYAIELSKSNKAKVNENYRICYFDIETNACVDSNEPVGEILSIVAQDSFTGELKSWWIDPDKENLLQQEIDMLNEFLIYLKKFDVLTGWNCLHKDTEILTDTGVKKIIDVNIGDNILSYEKNKTKFVKVKNKRIKHSKNNIRFKLERNNDIICTKEHKLYCYDNNAGFIFKPASKITKDDFLIRPKKINIKSKYNFNNNLCYLAGLIFTDGNISDDGKTIRIYSSKIDHIKHAIKLVNKFDKHAYYRKNKCEHDAYYIRIRDKKFINKIIDIGVTIGNKIKNKSDFNKILMSNNNNIRHFIAGLYDGDGCRYSIAMQSQGSEYIKYMFNKLGINYIYKKRCNNQEFISANSDGKIKFINIIKKLSLLKHRKNKLIEIHNKKNKYYNNNNKIIPLALENKYLNIIGLKNNNYNDSLYLRRIATFIPHCYYKKNSKNNYTKNYYKIVNSVNKIIKYKKKISKFTYNNLLKFKKELQIIDNIEFIKIYDIKSENNIQVVDIETENNVFIANTIVSHNCMKFDIPYTLNRAKKLGIAINKISLSKQPVKLSYRPNDSINPWYIEISGLNLVDMMQASVRALAYLDEKLKDSKLDTVAEAILGETKIHTDTPAVLFKQKRIKELVAYNEQDTLLLMKIDKKLGITDLLVSTLHFTPGLNLEEASYNSKIIDFYLLTKFNVVLPTVNRDNVGEVIGATVFEPVSGIHNNVAVFDIAGMYPNLIRTFNISPETIIDKAEDKCFKIENIHITTQYEGILVKLIKDFQHLRDKYKKLKKEHENDPDYEIYKLREFATKKILSSVYGVFGFAGFRLFNVDVANAITGSGRGLLQHMKKFAEDNNFEVVIGDTDSVFVKNKNINFTDYDKFNDDINNSLTEFVSKYTSNIEYQKNHTLEIEFETLFSRIIIPPAKKKYIGYVSILKSKKLDRPKLYFKGSELNKKDIPKKLKQVIREIVISVLDNASDENNVEIIKSKIDKAKEILHSSEINDLLIYKEINRDFNKYKQMPQHVKAAVNSNKYIGTDFSRQNYKGGILYVKSEKYKDIDVLFMNNDTKLTSDFKVDYDKYYEKFILNKINLIFGEVIYDKIVNKNRKLSDFFITKKVIT